MRNDMATSTFDDLDDLGLRGRVFYEVFPGTAASDAWRAAFVATHHVHAASDSADADETPDDALDEIADETFPASDPPANTVETGIRVGTIPTDAPLPSRPAKPRGDHDA
jgi:hypothetical protein